MISWSSLQSKLFWQELTPPPRTNLNSKSQLRLQNDKGSIIRQHFYLSLAYSSGVIKVEDPTQICFKKRHFLFCAVVTKEFVNSENLKIPVKQRGTIAHWDEAWFISFEHALLLVVHLNLLWYFFQKLFVLFILRGFSLSNRHRVLKEYPFSVSPYVCKHGMVCFPS